MTTLTAEAPRTETPDPLLEMHVETGRQLREPLAIMVSTIDEILRDPDLDPALRRYVAELGVDAETLYTLAEELELSGRDPATEAVEA